MERKKPLADTFKKIADDNPLSKSFSAVGKSMLGIKKSMETLVNVTKKEADLFNKERKLDADSLRMKKERNKRFSLTITKKLKDIAKNTAKSVNDAIGNILKLFLAAKFFELIKNIHDNWKSIEKWWGEVQTTFTNFTAGVQGAIDNIVGAYEDIAGFAEEVIQSLRGMLGFKQPEVKKTEDSTGTSDTGSSTTSSATPASGSSTATHAKPSSVTKVDSNLKPKPLPQMNHADMDRFNQNSRDGGFDIGFINTKAPLSQLMDSFKEVERTKNELSKQPDNPNLKKLLKQAEDNLAKQSKSIKELNLKFPKSKIDEGMKNPETKGYMQHLTPLVVPALDPVEKKQDGGMMMPGGGSIRNGAPVGDSVPAMLERGEYVLNRKAVQAIGLDKLNKINFKDAPRFQSGGIVGWSGNSGRSTGPHIHLERIDRKNYSLSEIDDFIRIGGRKLSQRTSDFSSDHGDVNPRRPNHKGKDWGIPIGTSIQLTNGTKLLRTVPDDGGGYGNYLDFQTPNGRKWRIAHLSKFGSEKSQNASPEPGSNVENTDSDSRDMSSGAMSGAGQMTGFMKDIWDKITGGLSAAGVDLEAITAAFGSASEGLTGENSPFAPIMNIFNGSSGAKPAEVKSPNAKPAESGPDGPKSNEPKPLSAANNNKALLSSTGSLVSGLVSGAGTGDTVPAMLEPGEFVMNREAVASLGLQTLEDMNVNRFTDASGGRHSSRFTDGSGRRERTESMMISSIMDNGVDIKNIPMPKMNTPPSSPKAAAGSASERPLPNLSAFPPSRVMNVMAFRFPGATYDLVG